MLTVLCFLATAVLMWRAMWAAWDPTSSRVLLWAGLTVVAMAATMATVAP
jgi:hypothetical protein